MARIKGVDIPNDKHIVISLTYIYGIGRSLARKICKETGVEPTKKAGDLSQEELIKLRDEINNHLTEGDLRREINMNIKILYGMLHLMVQYPFLIFKTIQIKHNFIPKTLQIIPI